MFSGIIITLSRCGISSADAAIADMNLIMQYRGLP